MSVESEADRLIFLGPEFGGVIATFRPASGGSAPVAGLLDAVRDVVLDGAGMGNDYATPGADGPRPRFLVRTADIPGVAEGDTLTIGDADYLVDLVRPDGTGMTVIWLGVADP